MSTSPDPSSLVQQPRVAAWVERQRDGDFLIGWTREATGVAIYAGASPETIDRAAPLATGPTPNGQVRVGNPIGLPRPYFELEFAGTPTGNDRLVVAERVLPLQGGVNFRDIGGYAARDGRTVRWGRVYRSGLLSDLTEEDLSFLSAAGIRVACDLRTATEVAARPDRLPPTAAHWHLPIGGRVSRARRMAALFRKRDRLREVLQEAYTRVMVDQNGAVFGQLFHRLADPATGPMIIHCMVGKDRTGVATALLLALLGVDDETIAADYSLSNLYFDQYSPQLTEEMQPLYAMGFSEAQVRPFMLAEPATILGTLAHVRGRYGSVRGYLSRTGGVTPQTVQRVQDNLLT